MQQPGEIVKIYRVKEAGPTGCVLVGSLKIKQKQNESVVACESHGGWRVIRGGAWRCETVLNLLGSYRSLLLLWQRIEFYTA